KVKNIARSLNLALEEGSTGGMSDANITSALGIPTLDGLGAVGGGLHARHEHLYLDHIPMRIALLVKILTEID
ncbi:MAG TPA: M20/M25/M40 family metallo-hydrolase, partial [Bacillota bacterium]|nr:M20/M25/M40 family metallo-hydrolase [Bacillota bacterium]